MKCRIIHIENTFLECYGELIKDKNNEIKVKFQYGDYDLECLKDKLLSIKDFVELVCLVKNIPYENVDIHNIIEIEIRDNIWIKMKSI